MSTEIEAKLKISAQDRTAKAFATIEGRLKKAERMTALESRQQRQMAAFERSAARVDRTLWMGGAAIAGGLAAAGGIRGGLTTLVSYEDALIEIAKKGGLTAEQMREIGREAKQLATSGELAVPLDEILSSYERAAAAGLPIEEWRQFAALSAKAADAFGMTAEEVGNAAAGFKVGLGIPMTEMERYFDLINSLADSGISDESDIIKFLDNAGAGLKNFGLSAREAAAYGAALLNLKLNPETGARMMNALTSKLIAPENLGKKGYSALGEVVGDVKAFKEELGKDPQSALRKFLGQLGKLDKFKRARLTGAIFGMEWSDEIMRLVDGLQEVDRNIEMASGKDWFGSLSKSYQMKLDALSSRWQLFKNQVSEVTIDLGELSMPALEAGLERARALLREISDELGTFDDKLDAQALSEAQRALSELGEALSTLVGIDPSTSMVADFFRDLAMAVNEISAGIGHVRDFFEWMGSPGDRVETLPPEEVARRKAEYDAKVRDEGESWYEKARRWTGASWLGSAPWDPGSPVPPSPAAPQEPPPAPAPAPAPVPGQLWDAATEIHDWMNWWHAELRAAAEGAAPPAIPGSTDQPSGTPSSFPPDDPQGQDEISLDPPRPPGPPATLPPPDEAARPDDRWIPAPPQSLPSASDLPPLTLQIDGANETADVLRQAMEQGGGDMRLAGSESAAAIREAARELLSAAESIGENGRQAAAAISSARITVPPIPGPRAAPNANLGQSMPNAGLPGGG